MSTNTRLINQKSLVSIIKKRTSVPTAKVGRKAIFTVQGDGNVIDVKRADGSLVVDETTSEVLQKRIFNLRATSQMSLSNARNVQLLKDAIAAEKAGDMEAAHDLYNDFLNKTQMSFGIILPSATADKLSSGVEISATISLVETENGQLLTIDPSSISVMAPEVLGSVAFDIDALLGEDEAEETAEEVLVETPAQKAARLKAEAKAAKALKA